MRIPLKLFLGRLQGRVRRIERHIEKQRRIRIMGFDNIRRFLPHQIRCVSLFVNRLTVPVPIVPAVPIMSKVIQGPIIVAVLQIEATLQRQVLRFEMTQMPLANDRRCVASRLHSHRQGLLLQRQPMTRPRFHHAALQAVAHRIAPRHQGRSRRRTHRLRIKLIELDAASRQAINMRRGDLPFPMIAHIAPSKIIRQHHDDVRTLAGE